MNGSFEFFESKNVEYRSRKLCSYPILIMKMKQEEEE